MAVPPATRRRPPPRVRSGPTAGRLPVGTATADYVVSLTQNQDLTVSLAHNGVNNCRLQVDLLAPSAMNFFSDDTGARVRMSRWLDAVSSGGAAAGDPTGDRLGAGGHLQAPVAGTYTVRVSSTNEGSECHYRLFIAKSDQTGVGFPAW